jgi:hypothetical protein
MSIAFTVIVGIIGYFAIVTPVTILILSRIKRGRGE